MVPKADSGAFLLLFLLVLTVTEPLRPGARGGAGGRGRGGQGRGRPGPPFACWGRVPGGRLPRPSRGALRPPSRARAPPGPCRVFTWWARAPRTSRNFVLGAVAFGSTSVERLHALRLMEASDGVLFRPGAAPSFLVQRLGLGWG